MQTTNLAAATVPPAAPCSLDASALSFAEVPGHGPDFDRLRALRYKVYCLEEGFLPSSDYPEGLESDEYDDTSTHIGAFAPEGEPVGALRLVRHTPRGLPLEARAGAGLSAEGRALLRAGTAEISRLVIPRTHRQFGFGRREGPAILFGLFGAMFRASLSQGLTHWVAAMEPCLWRLLKRYGFRFEPIGASIEYYGRVTPYAGRIDEIARHVADSRPEVYSAVTGAASASC